MSKLPSSVVRYLDMDEADASVGLTDAQRGVVEKVNRRVAASESLERLVDFLFESTADMCPCDRIGLAQPPPAVRVSCRGRLAFTVNIGEDCACNALR